MTIIIIVLFHHFQVQKAKREGVEIEPGHPGELEVEVLFRGL